MLDAAGATSSARTSSVATLECAANSRPGHTDVTEICVSLDGGASWVQGDFLDPIVRHAWRRWKYDWITPVQPGRYTLLARAIGADQRAQPDDHNPNFGSYVIDHPLPIEVFVASL